MKKIYCDVFFLSFFSLLPILRGLLPLIGLPFAFSEIDLSFRLFENKKEKKESTTIEASAATTDIDVL